MQSRARLFRPLAALPLACLLFAPLATAGCGSGGGGNQQNTPPTVGSQFATRFTVFTDPVTGAVTYRDASGSLVTGQALSNLIQADVVNQGGASFAVYDMSTQQYDPGSPFGVGRYLVTVRNVGTTQSPVLRYSFLDNQNPGRTFDTYDVPFSSQGVGLFDTSLQTLRNSIVPLGSTTGLANAIVAINQNYQVPGSVLDGPPTPP